MKPAVDCTCERMQAVGRDKLSAEAGHVRETGSDAGAGRVGHAHLSVDDVTAYHMESNTVVPTHAAQQPQHDSLLCCLTPARIIFVHAWLEL